VGARAGLPLQEFDAYYWEIANAKKTGVIKKLGKLEDLGKRLYKLSWKLLTDDEKKARQVKYDKAIKIVRDAKNDQTWDPSK
jgi:hypothetical protein